ncbi:hypothetical protein V8F20_011738 [Naviculisporaceae sp. PSN 640]
MFRFLQVLWYFFRTVLFSVFSGLHRARLDKLLKSVHHQEFAPGNHLHGTNYLASIASKTHMESSVHVGGSRNPTLRTEDMPPPRCLQSRDIHLQEQDMSFTQTRSILSDAPPPRWLQSRDTHLKEQDMYFTQTRSIFPVDDDDFPEEWRDDFGEEEESDYSYFALSKSSAFTPDTGCSDFPQTESFSYTQPPGSVGGQFRHDEAIGKEADNSRGTKPGYAAMTRPSPIDDRVASGQESEDTLGVQ